jgi:hypothetical protein
MRWPGLFAQPHKKYLNYLEVPSGGSATELTGERAEEFAEFAREFTAEQRNSSGIRHQSDGARLPLRKTPQRAILRPKTTGNPGNAEKKTGRDAR